MIRRIAVLCIACLAVLGAGGAAAAPIATTVPADSITQTSAKLKGVVNPNGGVTTVSFLYGAGAATQSASAGVLAANLGDTAVSALVTNLTCNTQYQFLVRAQSGEKGTPPVEGATLSFTTSACTSPPPTAVTVDANAISTTGATLRGSVNPNGTATSVFFDYGVSADNLDQAASVGSIGAGNASVAVSKALTTLVCGTTYFFQVRAQAATTVRGAILNFSTSTCTTPPPAVSIASPTGVSGTAATFNGTVNPSGTATTATFEYGTSPDVLLLAASFGSVGSGLSAVPVAKAVSGLACGTTYYARLSATNAGGTNATPPISFATSACAGAPGAITGSATAISDTGATLQGTVNPNNLATSVFFDYGLAGGTLDRSVVFGPAGSGSSGVAVASAVTGLVCGSQYDFRVRATSSGGTTNGATANFATLACSANAPGVSTESANTITATSAKLRAFVNANGSATTLSFDYGSSPSNLDQELFYGGTGSGSSFQLFSATLSGLACGTTYYFRARAENPSGVNYGEVESFATSACTVPLPTVGTSAASAITATGATLNGSANPNGNAASGFFDYGLAPASLDQAASFGALGSGSAPVPYAKAITGLVCNTNYYFRARATNASGAGIGNTLTFKTGACPLNAPVATTLPASAIAPGGATLNATVDPKGATTSVYFDYGLSPGSLDQSSFYGYASGTSVVPIGMPLSNRACDTVYYFRVRAVSVNGTGFGALLNFTTGGCGPQCTVDYPLFCGGGDFWANNNPGSTNVVTQYTCNGSTLGFSTGPEYTYIFSSPDAVQATIQMSGLSADLDLFALTSPGGICSGDNCIRISAFGGTTNETVSFPAKANTTYYVVVDGFAGSTSSYALNVSCAPVSTPPSASTVGASAITQSIATLNGSANPNGGETTVYFDYGLSPGNLDQTVTYGSIGAGTGEVPVALQVFGLACANTYYYRTRAENAAGTVVGATQPFTTGVCGGVCVVDYPLDCININVDNWANNNPGSTNSVTEYTCNGFTFGNEVGPEYSYSLTPPAGTVVSVTLGGLSSDLDLFVLSAPSGVCSGLNCLRLSGVGGTTAENVTFLATGQDYRVVVDGYAGNTSAYQLTVGCAANTISADGFE